MDDALMVTSQYIPAMAGETDTGASITGMPRIVAAEEADDKSLWDQVVNFYTNYWGAVGAVITGDQENASAYGSALLAGETAKTQVQTKDTQSSDNPSTKLILILGVLLVFIYLKRKRG
jgi:hypothetical protein